MTDDVGILAFVMLGALILDSIRAILCRPVVPRAHDAHPDRIELPDDFYIEQRRRACARLN